MPISESISPPVLSSLAADASALLCAIVPLITPAPDPSLGLVALEELAILGEFTPIPIPKPCAFPFPVSTLPADGPLRSGEDPFPSPDPTNSAGKAGTGGTSIPFSIFIPISPIAEEVEACRRREGRRFFGRLTGDDTDTE